MLFTIIDKSVLILTDNPQPGSRLGILFGQDCVRNCYKLLIFSSKFIKIIFLHNLYVKMKWMRYFIYKLIDVYIEKM